MALLDEIGAYIAAAGYGTLGTDIFEALMPDTPDNLTALFETSGMPSTYTYGKVGGALVEAPRFQVMVRNTSYSGAKTQMTRVYKLLDAVAEVTMTGIIYHGIKAAQAPFGMGRDKSDRWLLACNFEAMKDQS